MFPSEIGVFIRFFPECQGYTFFSVNKLNNLSFYVETFECIFDELIILMFALVFLCFSNDNSSYKNRIVIRLIATYLSCFSIQKCETLNGISKVDESVPNAAIDNVKIKIRSTTIWI